MKALVLCAGKGTRLGALCADRPKPLLDVGGSAIVEHILVRLARCGFRDVYLNLHHHAAAFPERLGDGTRFGLRLHYLHEPAPLGTGGTSRNLLARLAGEAASQGRGEGQSDLLVHYGDILTEHDLRTLVDAHRRTGALATALLHQRAGSNSHALLDDADRITTFLERPSQMPRDARSWVFSGICVLAPGCLDWLPGPGDRALDLPCDLFQPLAHTGRLFGQRLAGYRCAVDSQERLEAARRAFVGGQFTNQEVL